MNVALRSSLFHARNPYSTSHRVHHRLTLVTKSADRIYLVTLHCCEYRNRLGAERKHEHINGPYIYRMIYVPARHWKGAAMTHEDGTTPLNHLVKGIETGRPFRIPRTHLHQRGRACTSPPDACTAAGDRAVADRRVEDGLAQPAPPFGARVFHRGGRYTPGFAVRRGDLRDGRSFSRAGST